MTTLPMNWNQLTSYLSQNELFARTQELLETYLRSWHQENSSQFLNDMGADLSAVLTTYHFEKGGISFSRDFFRELDYISVWLTVEDSVHEYVCEYTVFYDKELNAIDDRMRK